MNRRNFFFIVCIAVGLLEQRNVLGDEPSMEERIVPHPYFGCDYKIWIGPDYTIYRQAMPPAVREKVFVVIYLEGKAVLGGGFKEYNKETKTRYEHTQPGHYTMFMCASDGRKYCRISNIIEYDVQKSDIIKMQQK